jgi:Chaperone of endosialidase
MSPRLGLALGLLGIAIWSPLACKKANPAFDLGDAGETRGDELESSAEGNSAEGNSAEGDGDPSTGDGDPSTGDGDPSTGDGDPSTGDGDPSTGDGDPSTGDGDPSTGDGDPTTGDGDPTTGDGDGDGGLVPKLDMMAGDGDGDGGLIPMLDMMAGDGDGDPCSGQGQSCANGEMCCFNLECCAGNPIPRGQEYCSGICPNSDRNAKFAFQSVDSQWVLDRVVDLPISTWSYKDGKDGHARHIGPMAQDFHSAFDVGASDRYIFQVDGDGVSLAAIQALDAKVDALEADNAQLRASLNALQERLEKLDK